MTTYVCLSRICEHRDRCVLQRAPQDTAVHVTYFQPQEEKSGNCPHYLHFRDSLPAEIQR